MSQTDKKDEVITEIVGALSVRVILYNDDAHTFDAVTSILIAATGCSSRKAFYHAYNVDKSGHDIVYSGDMEKAIQVSSIIESIGLKTAIVA